MKTKVVVLFCFFLILIACSDKKEVVDNPNFGEISIETDEGYADVVKQLAYRYEKSHPDAKINVAVQKENLALKRFFEKKTKAIVLSRSLKASELEYFTQNLHEDYQPAYFAADAVCFVVPKNSPITQLTVAEIKQKLQENNSPFVFDGVNASNLNFVAETIGIAVKNLKFSVLEGNEKVINDIANYQNKIGVISYNVISKPYDTKAIELRNKVKVLPIFHQNSLVEVNKQNLKTQKYPFTRMLYYLTNERYYGLANGLIRYSCTQIGQLIVDKQGLQAFNVYPRNMQIKE